MQNIRLTLQYNGTRYLGWSRPEKNGQHKSVSYKITEILKKLTGEDIVLFGGAKTDPGVHALAQTASFRTASGHSPGHFREVLNEYLPRDIAILDAVSMPERFRADLNAVSRTYECRICTAPVYDIFTAGYQTHIFPAPDVEAMKHFLCQMPAVIAGTLLETGRGLRAPESIQDIFTGTEKAGAPLDAKGLLLQDIQY